jgi:hypothetical protein
LYLDIKKLDSTAFHELCDDLVKAIYPTAICIDGTGGDQGIDCYLGNLDEENLHIFQHKYLPRTLERAGKSQIERSLNTAFSNFKNVKKWTLLLPKKLTVEENKWLNSLHKKYNIEIELWDETKLKSLLFKFPSIRKEHLPLSKEDEENLNIHLSHLIEKVLNPLIQILRNEPENLPNLDQILNYTENHYHMDQSIDNNEVYPELDSIIIKKPEIVRSLCKDFLINPYPEIINEWSNIHHAYSCLNHKDREINKIFIGN